MKNKASLQLMELLVMVLAFSLAAAVCLGIFAWSSRTARETQRREEGALIAQNAAEYLKQGLDVNSLDTGDYTLEVHPVPSQVPGYLNQAVIEVFFGEKMVFTLEAGWQEVGP